MLGFSDIQIARDEDPVIRVVGVGGGGGNVIDRMIQSSVQCVEFIAANTDIQDLKNSAAHYKLQLGVHCTRGLGSGAKPEIGQQAAKESMELIRESMLDTDMVFITAGMGGGTGTGGAPVIAEVARDAGILTVGVVTLPFKFEGKQRLRNAQAGIQALEQHVDTLIVIPNDNLLQVADKRTSIVDAFGMADDVLRQAIQGISDLITNDGIINLDFADVRTVMKGQGKAVMGTGIATGERRAKAAAEKAINSPLLDNYKITGARGILINVVGSSSMTLHEVTEAATYIEEQAHEDATIVWGASIDSELDQQILITVIATGFDQDDVKSRPLNRNHELVQTEIKSSVATVSDEATLEPSSNELLSGTAEETTPGDDTVEQLEVSSQEGALVEGEELIPGEPLDSILEASASEQQVVKEEALELDTEMNTESSFLAQEQGPTDNAATTSEVISKETEHQESHPMDEALEQVSSFSEAYPEDFTPALEGGGNSGSQAFRSAATGAEAPEKLSAYDIPAEAVSAVPQSEFEAANFLVTEATPDVAEVNKSDVCLEGVETSPKYPDWALDEHNNRSFMDDLDIPAFIRRRTKKMGHAS